MTPMPRAAPRPRCEHRDRAARGSGVIGPDAPKGSTERATGLSVAPVSERGPNEIDGLGLQRSPGWTRKGARHRSVSSMKAGAKRTVTHVRPMVRTYSPPSPGAPTVSCGTRSEAKHRWGQATTRRRPRREETLRAPLIRPSPAKSAVPAWGSLASKAASELHDAIRAPRAPIIPVPPKPRRGCKYRHCQSARHPKKGRRFPPAAANPHFRQYPPGRIRLSPPCRG